MTESSFALMLPARPLPLPGQLGTSQALSPLKPRHLRHAVVQLKAIAVREGLGEFFLMRDEQDATHLAAQVLQFLDHHLAALAVEAAETLVDDDRLDWPVLPAGVLPDPQRQADGHAELLAAAE